ncbi:MAG: ABC transporter substrate-binding protein [Pseudomonadota bacterium]
MKIIKHTLAAGAIAAASVFAVPQASAETPPNMLVLGQTISDLITLDPAEIFEFSGGEIANNIYDRITTFEPGDYETLVGGATQSWQVSEDGKTITFTMRDGMTFHSGNPVRAEDAVFSLRRVVKLGKTPSFILTQLGWTPENVDDNVTVTGDGTFEIKIPADISPGLVLNALSATVGSVVDEVTVMANEVDGDLGYAWLKTNSAGSGPFSLRAWNANETVILDRYDGYWKGAASMERVIVRHLPEPAAQRLLLEKGDIDIARTLTPDQIAGLEGAEGVTIEDAPKTKIVYLAMNTSEGPLADPKVWEAMRWLVDYEGMLGSFLKGQYSMQQSFWPTGLFGSISENPYTLDIEKGKALLAEAGYGDGLTLTMDTLNVAPFMDIAQSVQQTLGQAGVTVEIVPQDGSALWPKYRARRHGLILAQWGPDYLDPHSNADSFAHNPDNALEAKLTGKLAWRNAWADETITGMTEAASQETDLDKRAVMYRDLLTAHQAGSPFVNMFRSSEQLAIQDGVTGFVSGPTFDLVFYDGVTKE